MAFTPLLSNPANSMPALSGPAEKVAEHVPEKDKKGGHEQVGQVEEKLFYHILYGRHLQGRKGDDGKADHRKPVEGAAQKARGCVLDAGLLQLLCHAYLLAETVRIDNP